MIIQMKEKPCFESIDCATQVFVFWKIFRHAKKSRKPTILYLLKLPNRKLGQNQIPETMWGISQLTLNADPYLFNP